MVLASRDKIIPNSGYLLSILIFNSLIVATATPVIWSGQYSPPCQQTAFSTWLVELWPATPMALQT